jgi:hypothetical protein
VKEASSKDFIKLSINNIPLLFIISKISYLNIKM